MHRADTPAGCSTATGVFGQAGSFTTSTTGDTATTLSEPEGIALDSSGNVYVADTNNNRMLYYPAVGVGAGCTAPNTPAGCSTPTTVWGQAGSLTCGVMFNNGACATGSASASNEHDPNALAVDGSGDLYEVDTLGNRILYYPSGSTTATRVYGQGGSFTTTALGTTATTLSNPEDVALDGSGNLYVADTANDRVLYFAAGTGCTAPNTPAGCGTATKVWGQSGSFTTGTSGHTATTLKSPTSVRVDSGGGLYVADYTNNRVLYFAAGSGCTAANTPAGCGTATKVYGQAGSFTGSSANSPSPSAASLDLPHGLTLMGRTTCTCPTTTITASSTSRLARGAPRPTRPRAAPPRARSTGNLAVSPAARATTTDPALPEPSARRTSASEWERHLMEAGIYRSPTRTTLHGVLCRGHGVHRGQHARGLRHREPGLRAIR